MNNNRKTVIGLVSVSDRASRGTYVDQGIPALQSWLSKVVLSPYEVVTALIPDERDQIEATLKRLVDEDHCDLVLTTGGTGPSRRDVTPEATLAVCQREMPGFGEQMRAVSLAFVPTAILSRQVAALRETENHSALIVNLPGQPKAIAETLEGLPKMGIHGIFAAIPYCIELIGGPSIETDPRYVKAFRPKSAARPCISDAVVLEPDGKADNSIIMLHGLGVDASDFAQFREELMSVGAPLQNTRMVLPNAPYIPISMNNGYEMRAWFDMYSLEKTDIADQKGLDKTLQIIRRLIAEEITRGIKPERIFLGGFSQGGCMALYAALKLDQPIGGFFCLSGYLPITNAAELQNVGAAITCPIFVGHGDQDSVVAPAYSAISVHELQKVGATHVEPHSYAYLEHCISPEEAQDLAQFLSKQLSAQ